MAIQNDATLKSYFETNDFPTQAQFADLIDSKLNLQGGTVSGLVTLSGGFNSTNVSLVKTQSDGQAIVVVGRDSDGLARLIFRDQNNLNSSARLSTPSAGGLIIDTLSTPNALVIDNAGNIETPAAVTSVTLNATTTNATTVNSDTASSFRVLTRSTNGRISGTNGGIVVASGGFIDLESINSSGGNWGALLTIGISNEANANIRTLENVTILGRGTSAVAAGIQSINGPSGGASFSLTYPANGVIRITNTSGGTCRINASYVGNNIN